YGTSDRVMYVPGIEPFLVTLEDNIAGPGWVVIQRRIDGTVDFNRNWTEYVSGFGTSDAEFWLGLERIHKITSQSMHKLYISIVDYNNKRSFAQYDHFVVGSKDEGYALKSLGKYRGNAGDIMHMSMHAKFSISSEVKSGWWHLGDT
ncbi:hypothetical protein KR222_005804, partial [Zaprionus bogoriensis]